MKVIAINGSPKKEGNTNSALKLVEAELVKEGIEVEIVHIGDKTLKGCLGCGNCAKNQDEKCTIDDGVNEVIQLIKEADGLLIGSPVHFSALGSTLKAFLDRASFVASVNGGMFRHKVGASVVALRRAGGIPTFNQINNYLTISEMMMPSSNYWNGFHGEAPSDLGKDEEGKQTMRILGKNMAWLMKLVENGKGKIQAPEIENKIFTNFIR